MRPHRSLAYAWRLPGCSSRSARQSRCPDNPCTSVAHLEPDLKDRSLLWRILKHRVMSLGLSSAASHIRGRCQLTRDVQRPEQALLPRLPNVRLAQHRLDHLIIPPRADRLRPFQLPLFPALQGLDPRRFRLPSASLVKVPLESLTSSSSSMISSSSSYSASIKSATNLSCACWTRSICSSACKAGTAGGTHPTRHEAIRVKLEDVLHPEQLSLLLLCPSLLHPLVQAVLESSLVELSSSLLLLN